MTINHLSTAYVFDGEKRGPHLENDQVTPRGLVAVKLDGDLAVVSLLPLEALPAQGCLFTDWNQLNGLDNS